MNEERPIEKLLRRYAKQRRDDAGAPLDLHPATRRLLLGEVSRQFPQAGAGTPGFFASWIAALRGRWVYAAAAGIVVVISAGVILMQTQPARFEAKQQELALGRSEVSPSRASDKDVSIEDRNGVLLQSIETLKPAAAPAPELTLSEPASLPPTPRANYAVSSDLGQGLVNSDVESKRQLKEESAPVPVSQAPRETEQVALARDRFAGKSPQPTATPEQSANAVNSAQLSTQSPARKPAPALPTSTVAGENQPRDKRSASPTSAVADSGVAQEFKLKSATASKASAPAGATVTTEQRYGLAPSTAGGSLQRTQSSPISQAFANRAPSEPVKTAAKATPSSSVLANFQIEQSGAQVRVIDSDGSIYLGGLSAEPLSFQDGRRDEAAVLSRAALAERQTPAAAPSSQQSTQNYLYRVTGTNRTLNQQVVFTWDFVPLTNAQAQSKAKRAVDSRINDSLGAQQHFPALLQNSTINGRAQINPAKEIEINAVPVTPPR